VKRDAAIHVRNVPDPIREKVTADAREHNVSVTDLVGEIVARHYGLGWEPTGYPFSGAGRNHWFIRMPRVLKHTLDAAADASGNTVTGCVLVAVAKHYGLPEPSARRRTAVEPQLSDAQIVEARRRYDAGEVSGRKLAEEMGVNRELMRRVLANR
jgi:hypothetical protein